MGAGSVKIYPVMGENLVLYILPLAGLLFILYVLQRLKKRYEKYFLDMGFERLSLRGFPWVRAEGTFNGTLIKVGTAGTKHNYRLYLETPTHNRGFLRLRRKDWLDSLFLKKPSWQYLMVEVYDPVWGGELLKQLGSQILQLFADHKKLQKFELKDGKLRIELGVKNPWDIPHEELQELLRVLLQIREVFDYAPHPTVESKEALVSLLSMKLPALFGTSLCLFGVILNPFAYDPVCIDDLFEAGFKLSLSFGILYAMFLILMLAGAPSLHRAVVGFFSLLVILFIFISVTFVPSVNGYFDSSQPVKRTDLVVKKYIEVRKGRKHYKIKLAGTPCDQSVSENFYNSVNEGDRLEYFVKRGFLGIEWFYRKLRRVVVKYNWKEEENEEARSAFFGSACALFLRRRWRLGHIWRF